MIMNKESEILYCFAREPWKKYNFTELLRISGKRSRSYLTSVLKKFVKNKILKQEVLMNLPVYSLNLDSLKSRVFAGFVLEYNGWNKKNIPYDILQSIIDKIPNKGYVFIITGSYAKEKQKHESDIDVVILIDDHAKPARVYAELSHYCELSIPQIHLYVFRNNEFVEMLRNKEENYGKETARNNLILAGGQIYIKLISEVIKNGFNG